MRVKNLTLLSLASFFCINLGYSQDTYQRNKNADVQQYRFNLSLNDESNAIKGEALITVSFDGEVSPFALDLIGKSEEYGMTVTKVLEGEEAATYSFSDNKISIVPKSEGPAERTFSVQYTGVAEKGLVIDTTKFGQRSFFGDNWPNLARHWLPSVDHPYDKASVEFAITAPAKYDVVATGRFIDEKDLGNGLKLTTYREPAPVAMKVVTIGVTKFSTKLLGTVGDVDVTAWVYPENESDGFSDYAVAEDVLRYFVDNIGPYSYAKLANMQAKTQWGGLENAGTIAYFENSVTGKNEVEGLIAHEIAHQWFGNSATENSWNHVWLSEGFATYFAILYQENVYGDSIRQSELKVDREQVIKYYKKKPAPIVDNSIADPMKVLSTNSYQKGGWVLNMLRKKLGDEVFWNGIRSYYLRYKDSNVMTVDLRRVMEESSGQDLEHFFQQWIFTEGHPKLKMKWKYKEGKVFITIEQKQKHFIYDFPLELGITNGDQQKIETVRVNSENHSFEFEVDTEPSIILDPNTWLLFDGK